MSSSSRRSFAFVSVWNHENRHIFFSFLACKASTTVATIFFFFFAVFLEPSFSDGRSISSQLYLFRKDLIFLIFFIFFLFLYDLTQLLWHIESIIIISIDEIYCRSFLSNHENIYIIQHNSYLF